MKFLRLALLLSAVALCVRADEDEQRPPEEIPDFSNLDDYIYTPKNTVNFGFRYMTGVKATFGGNGTIGAPEALPDTTTPNADRTYHDGTVQPDARTQTVDNGAGTTGPASVTSDGKTNTWSYDNNSQLTSDGFMQFHIYSAQTEDTGFHDKSGRGNSGMELTMLHDMGNLGKHFSWKIFGGFSVNDIQAATHALVAANVTTVTDTYDLYGQTPPGAPYSAPSSTIQNLTNASGAVITDSSGNPVTQTIDTTTLIGNTPLSRSTSSEVDSTSVLNNWKLHGAYATFRFGPTLVYDFTDRLHFSVSVGPALIYAGSTYTVDEVLMPADGSEIIDTLTNTKSKVLLGYYGDATLQYDITDRTGLYIGAFYQDAGGYSQETDPNPGATAYGNGNNTPGIGDYTTRVEFGSQQGLRTGLSYRF